MHFFLQGMTLKQLIHMLIILIILIIVMPVSVNSLTLGERAYLAFAVAANNQLQTEKGAHESISLLKKGLLVRRPPAVGYPDTDRFVIPESYRHECYIRFAGKADSLMDELIAQDKHGKNK